MDAVGTVYLVGAGPGDPGLITAKGLRRLREADVVVYDRLVTKELLKEVKEEAEVIYVGKNPEPGARAQENIYPLLIDKAREGKSVVRLKGGDPFVFGRGGEEAQVLAMAQIPFEVIPGVTSAIAAAAYAGIPVTHREAASSFTVVSAVEDPSKKTSSIAWDALARTGGTLVVLMGWDALEGTVARLIKEGAEPQRPVALVQWGTKASQRTVVGTLENIVARGREANLGPPVVTIIGPVVKLRDEIGWFDQRPLFGKRVLVTRSRIQASALCQLLTDEGAEALEVPAILIEAPEDFSCLDKAIGSLGCYRWLVFTSVNGVDAFFQRLSAQGLDARALGQAKVCAIGPATAAALKNVGLRADLVPALYSTKAIAQAMAAQGLEEARVLLPRANIAPSDLVAALEKTGAQVDQPLAYRTVIPQESRLKAREALGDGKIDIVTFTSSSTVRNLVDLLDGELSLLNNTLIACIGPVTTATATELGLGVCLEASKHTVEGLVESLKDFFVETR
jgi:uroporphyrinogen III methyltransferase/synthase